MVVADAMVVIHLAKITLLEKTCELFRQVAIPQEVQREVLAGKAKGYGDAELIEELLKARKLAVRRVRLRELLKRAGAFNLQRGEAEVAALYWQEQADYVASDDDNVRKKAVLLNIRCVGTPAIILRLYNAKLIDRAKVTESLTELRKIGWFSSAIIDTIAMEVT